MEDKIDFSSDQVLEIKGKTLLDLGNNRICQVIAFNHIVLNDYPPQAVAVCVKYSDNGEYEVFSSETIEEDFRYNEHYNGG